jgi:hypothetical protein
MQLPLIKLQQSNEQPLYVSPADILVLESATKQEKKEDKAHSSSVLFGSENNLTYARLNIPFARLKKMAGNRPRISLTAVPADQDSGPENDREMLVPVEWVRSIVGITDHKRAASRVSISFPQGIQSIPVTNSAEDIYEAISAETPQLPEIPEGVTEDGEE